MKHPYTLLSSRQAALGLALGLTLVTGAALAADRGDDSFFGIVDGAAALNPQTTQIAPIVAKAGADTAAASPVYLHLRPNAQQRWTAACSHYKACSTPVFFVTEAWYRNVYLPAVGGQNGMEQRYRDTVRADRTERDTGRHRHTE